jgi:cobalt/nickel transport system ATP-binding protein
LDKDARDKIVECIKKVNITTLAVSHDWDFLEQVTESLYVMEDGKCRAGGKELLLHRHAHLHPVGNIEHEHSKVLNN